MISSPITTEGGDTIQLVTDLLSEDIVIEMKDRFGENFIILTGPEAQALRDQLNAAIDYLEDDE